MTTTIRKIGNSAGIILPKDSLREAGFVDGQEIHVVVLPGSITLYGETHVDVSLTLGEAAALLDTKEDDPDAVAARTKIRRKLYGSE